MPRGAPKKNLKKRISPPLGVFRLMLLSPHSGTSFFCLAFFSSGSSSSLEGVPRPPFIGHEGLRLFSIFCFEWEPNWVSCVSKIRLVMGELINRQHISVLHQLKVHLGSSNVEIFCNFHFFYITGINCRGFFLRLLLVSSEPHSRCIL